MEKNWGDTPSATLKFCYCLIHVGLTAVMLQYLKSINLSMYIRQFNGMRRYY